MRINGNKLHKHAVVNAIATNPHSRHSKNAWLYAQGVQPLRLLFQITLAPRNMTPCSAMAFNYVSPHFSIGEKTTSSF